MKSKVYNYMERKDFLLWLLLHFLPTYKNCDYYGKDFATVVYVKKFRGGLYVWKVKYYRRDEAGEFKRLRRKEICPSKGVKQ